MWTSELHRAVAHASQDQIIGKRECAAGQGGGGHRFQIRNYQLRIKNENGETSKIQRSMERSGRAIKRSIWRLLLTFCTKTRATLAGLILS
jgi:hypothetical protein